jgi:hypothetical protein
MAKTDDPAACATTTATSEADWTGVAPDLGAVAPLTSASFEQRLANLTAAATALAKMRQAMIAQHPEYAPGLPETTEAPG